MYDIYAYLKIYDIGKLLPISHCGTLRNTPIATFKASVVTTKGFLKSMYCNIDTLSLNVLNAI